MGAFNKPGSGAGGGMTQEQYANLTQDAELSSAVSAIQSSITDAVNETALTMDVTMGNHAQGIVQSIDLSLQTADSEAQNRLLTILDSIATVKADTSYNAGDVKYVRVDSQGYTPPAGWALLGGISALASNSQVVSNPTLSLCNIPVSITNATRVFKSDNPSIIFSMNNTNTSSDATGFTALNRYFNSNDTTDTLSVTSTIAARFACGGQVQVRKVSNLTIEPGPILQGVARETTTTDGYLYCFGSPFNGTNNAAFRIDVSTGVRTSILANSSIAVGFASVTKIGDLVVFLGGAPAAANSGQTFGINTGSMPSVATASKSIFIYNAANNTYTELANNLAYKFLFNGRNTTNSLARAFGNIYLFVPAYYALAADTSWTQNTAGTVFAFNTQTLTVEPCTGFALGALSEAACQLFYFGTNAVDGVVGEGYIINRSRQKIKAVPNGNGAALTDAGTVPLSGTTSGTIAGFDSSYYLSFFLTAQVTLNNGSSAPALLRGPKFVNVGYTPATDYVNQSFVTSSIQAIVKL